jgi:gas vesicle protein
MKTSNILLSVLGSAFVGALLGVLYAPDKGTKTRKQLAKKGDEYADTAKKEYDVLIDKMGKQYEALKSQSEEVLNKGKSRAEKLKEDLKKSVSK